MEAENGAKGFRGRGNTGETLGFFVGGTLGTLEYLEDGLPRNHPRIYKPWKGHLGEEQPLL